MVNGVDEKDQYKFPYAPDQKFSIGLDYYKPVAFGALKARLDYSWIDDHNLYPEPKTAALTKVESYGLLNGRIALTEVEVGEMETLELAIWGKNLTDEEYRLNGFVSTPDVSALNFYGNPRTYGVEATYRF